MEGAPTPVPRDAHACGGSCASSQGMASGAACAPGARPPASPQTPDLGSIRRNHFTGPAGRALSMSSAPPAPITRADLTRAFETQLRNVQDATTAGTLKDDGPRPGRLRQHIGLGLAPVQALLGQQNTVQHGQCEFHGRHDTAGGQVSPHMHGPAQNAHAHHAVHSGHGCAGMPVACAPVCAGARGGMSGMCMHLIHCTAASCAGDRGGM